LESNNEVVMKCLDIALAVALLGVSAPPAAAQATAASGTGPSEYRSAFQDYRPFKDQPPASWRAVNDEVARVGGHAGALKGGASMPPPGSVEERPGTPPARAPGSTAPPSHPAHH
jgi:hypothetical protein